jgi:hypothetical protein
MSALPPKADIVQHGGNVRFVPARSGHQASPIRYLVGERPGKERSDAASKFELVCLFDSSHLCHSGS